MNQEQAILNSFYLPMQPSNWSEYSQNFQFNEPMSPDSFRNNPEQISQLQLNGFKTPIIKNSTGNNDKLDSISSYSIDHSCMKSLDRSNTTMNHPVTANCLRKCAYWSLTIKNKLTKT